MKYLIFTTLSLMFFIHAKETSSATCHVIYNKKSNQIYNNNGYIETKSEYRVTTSKNENSTSSFVSSTIVSDGNSKLQFSDAIGKEDLSKKIYKISINKKGEVEFDKKTYYVLDKKHKKAKNLSELAKYNTIKAESNKENIFLQVLDQNKQLKLRTVLWNNKGRFEVNEYSCN